MRRHCVSEYVKADEARVPRAGVSDVAKRNHIREQSRIPAPARETIKSEQAAFILPRMLDDVTERKRLEAQLQQAREELEGKVEREMVRKNPYRLTFREFTILHFIAAGRADKEIARELGISPLTVHKHVANILGKMNAASRTEAGVRALREGLVD